MRIVAESASWRVNTAILAIYDASCQSRPTGPPKQLENPVDINVKLVLTPIKSATSKHSQRRWTKNSSLSLNQRSVRKSKRVCRGRPPRTSNIIPRFQKCRPHAYQNITTTARRVALPVCLQWTHKFHSRLAPRAPRPRKARRCSSYD